MKKIFFISVLAILTGNEIFAQCSTNISGTLTSCGAGCNGTVIFTSSSGTPPYNLVVTTGPSVQYNSSYTWTSVCPGSYHYDVTDATASCHDTGTVVVTGIPTTVTPPALTIEAYDLIGNFLGNNPTICQFQSIDFYVQMPYEATEPKIFKWKKNGIIVSTQSAVNPSPPGISWNSSTLVNGDVITLTIIFTNPPPCYSPDSVTSQNMTFTVTPNQPPVVNISSNIPNDTICLGNTITFTASPIDAGTPSYEWYLDGAPVGSGSTYTSISTLPAGNHQVLCCITSSEYCDIVDPVFNPTVCDTINFYVQPCLSVPEQRFGKSLMAVFPNPVTNQCTIYDVRFTILEIGIYNVLGEKIYSEKPVAGSPKQITINVSAFPRGIYFVKLNGEHEEGIAKFAKQ